MTNTELNNIFVSEDDYYQFILDHTASETIEDAKKNSPYLHIELIANENGRINSILNNPYYQSILFPFCDFSYKNYNGGYWDFYHISNGGAFLVLKTEGLITVSSPNGSEEILDNISAGYYANQMILSSLSFSERKDLAEFACNLYHKNRPLMDLFNEKIQSKLYRLLD